MKLREELIFVKPSFAKVEKSFSMLGAHSNVREMCVCVCRKREREREPTSLAAYGKVHSLPY